MREQGNISPEDDRWAEKQRSRLEAWSASLGVNARGRMSIAYRLRLNPSMAMMIFQLLEGVELCLELLVTKLKQVQPTEVEMPNEVPDKTITAEKVRDNANAGVGLLIDIASDLRKLGTQKEEQKALDFDPVDEEGNSLVEDFKHYIRTQCHLHLARTRMRIATGDLHSERESWLANGTEQFVQELVSPDGMSGLSAEFISTRLQATILQRWRLLCYRSRHASSLAVRDSITQSGEEPEDNDVTLPQGNETAISAGPQDLTQVPTGARTVLTSAATVVTADRKFAQRHLQEEASKTAITKSSGVALGDIDFPPEPEVGEHEALCPICWIPTPAKDLRGRRWRSAALRASDTQSCALTDVFQVTRATRSPTIHLRL